MTIEKAIEILSDTESTYRQRHWDDYIVALKLGIEALKRLQQQRGDESRDPFWHLPGETKED